MGGLSRKYTKIQELRGSNDTLLVESGNTFFKTDDPLKVSSKELAKARGIAQIYAEMDYDAINIGAYDLTAGLSFIQDLFFLPWVSANYYDAKGQPLFRPYVLKKTPELTIGIIGLSPSSNKQKSDTQYRPWQEVLPSLLVELDKQTDMIVILSSLAMTENKSIASTFPSIRIIFTAIPGIRVSNIQKENKVLLTQTMVRGRYLGYLFLKNPQLQEWQERAKVQEGGKQLRTVQYRLDRIDTILQRQANTSEPRRNQLIKEKEELELLLNNWEHQKEQVGASYFYRNIPILQNIRPNDKIENLLVSIEEEMKNVNIGK